MSHSSCCPATLLLQVIGELEPEAQKLLDRCEQLLDIALSTDINAGAGAVSAEPVITAQCALFAHHRVTSDVL
jgi:hypothetical protein